jgi:Tfp pilus assembly protein PilF
MGAGAQFEIRFNPGCRELHIRCRRQEAVQTGSIRLSSLHIRRGMSCAVMTCVLSVLAACSSAPKKDDVAAKLAAQEQANEHMVASDKALRAGHVEQAMEQLEAAIKSDPATKTPWLKKAQIHFDAREYGHAITQAQEVLQRDVNDLTAKSILAVSGLRVSAAALEQLRKGNEVTGSARSEAESVAKIIREALGEPILVPAPPLASASEPASKTSGKAFSAGQRSSVPRTAVRPVPISAGAAASPAPAAPLRSTASVNGAAGSPSGRNNPFGALQ